MAEIVEAVAQAPEVQIEEVPIRETRLIPEPETVVSGPVEPAPAPEKPAVIEITAEEKFELRDLETSFLKAQIETERLQRTMKDIQGKFPTVVNQLVSKYGVNIADYTFDAVSLTFKKR